jgi:hypothetical protein
MPNSWVTPEIRPWFLKQCADYQKARTSVSRNTKNDQVVAFLIQFTSDFQKKFGSDALTSMELPDIGLGGTQTDRETIFMRVSINVYVYKYLKLTFFVSEPRFGSTTKPVAKAALPIRGDFSISLVRMVEKTR